MIGRSLLRNQLKFAVKWALAAKSAEELLGLVTEFGRERESERRR